MNGLLFPSSRHKMPLSLFPWESQLLRLGVEGEERQENGLSPCAVCPRPNMGTEGLSVTQPEASPGMGTVWPLSPGQGAMWGCLRATGARGRGRRAPRDAGLAGVGGGMVKEQSPPGSCEGGQADFPEGLASCPPVQVSP